MARAKRTDRAEARRRYRASIGEPLDDERDLEDDAEPAASPARPAAGARPVASARSSGAASTPPVAPRPSMTGAFRSSFRPVDWRGDLRALPMLLRHKALLIPVILSGASVAALPLLGANALTSAFYQYFSFTAPLGAAFLAGFLAPRASWLVGLLAGLASFGFQALAFNVGPFGGLFDKDFQVLVLNQALVVGVPSAALFAAAAAWYKRFLNRASPSRQRAAASTGRRPDGKQPKRNEPRPILARRR